MRERALRDCIRGQRDCVLAHVFSRPRNKTVLHERFYTLRCEGTWDNKADWWVVRAASPVSAVSTKYLLNGSLQGQT